MLFLAAGNSKLFLLSSDKYLLRMKKRRLRGQTSPGFMSFTRFPLPSDVTNNSPCFRLLRNMLKGQPGICVKRNPKKPPKKAHKAVNRGLNAPFSGVCLEPGSFYMQVSWCLFAPPEASIGDCPRWTLTIA